MDILIVKSRSVKSLFLFALLIIVSSCTAREVQDAFPEEMLRIFNEARLPLLGQKISSRDFSLPLLMSEGVPESLRKHMSLSELKGQVVFLNFWATWCGPCRDEMPSMEALYNRFKDRGLEILAVNSMERSDEVVEFMQSYGLSFPTVLDTDGIVTRAYGISAIPTSYLIDREGNIVVRLVGSIDWDTPEIHRALEQLLDF